jgi:hypothetical protein
MDLFAQRRRLVVGVSIALHRWQHTTISFRYTVTVIKFSDSVVVVVVDDDDDDYLSALIRATARKPRANES